MLFLYQTYFFFKHFEIVFISPPSPHLDIWFSTEHSGLSSCERVIIEQIVVTVKNLLHHYEDALENNSLERLVVDTALEHIKAWLTHLTALREQGSSLKLTKVGTAGRLC